MSKVVRYLCCMALLCSTTFTLLSAVHATDASQSQSVMVNINTASEAELTTLPGVGPAKARAIMATRSETPFKSIEELTRVKGIGEALLEKLRSHITVTELRSSAPSSQTVVLKK